MTVERDLGWTPVEILSTAPCRPEPLWQALSQPVGEYHARTREMAIRRRRELVGLARPPRPCPGPQHRDIEARGRLRDRSHPAVLRGEVGAETAASRAAALRGREWCAGLSLKVVLKVSRDVLRAG